MNIEFAQRIASHAQDALGKIFTEENDFRLHIQGLMRQGDVVIEKRIALLFAIWSNINSLGDSIEVDAAQAPLAMHLRDRKFSIASELAILTNMVVKRVFSVELELKTQERVETFKEILNLVDQKCREQRLTDAQAMGLLINLLGSWCRN